MSTTKSESRVFDNPVLDKLTESNIYIHTVFYGVLVVFYFSVSVIYTSLLWWQNALLFLGAIFFWTFAEYILHRYLFHIAEKSKFTKRLQYILHGVHHDQPRDKIFMPPVPGLILSSFFLGIFYIVYWLFGLGEMAWIFTSGFIMGYFLYSMVHYGTHKVKPPSYLRELWTHHLLHHYQYPDKAFGVSNRFWDRIFGTMPPKKNTSGSRKINITENFHR